jgi:AraC-like DNA-binding protein
MVLTKVKLTPSYSLMSFKLRGVYFANSEGGSSDNLLKPISSSRPSACISASAQGAAGGLPVISEPLRPEAEALTSPLETSNGRPPNRANGHLASWRVKKAQEMMMSLMTQSCSIDQVANECAISRSHFSRAFKNATGLAPHDWLQRERMLKAEKLLRAKRISISCVAQECGFSDQSYFTRVFRKSKGISPRRWQIQHCSVITTDESIGLDHSPHG